MRKKQRKLTPKEKAQRRRRCEEYMTIFVNGKQKCVKRPETIDGMDVDEFILRNADPIWLHQNGMWEYMMEIEEEDEMWGYLSVAEQQNGMREYPVDAEKEVEGRAEGSGDIPF